MNNTKNNEKAIKNEFIYTAWFRDPSLDKNDQDYEWCACFIIIATNEQKAIIWGNKLSELYSKRSSQVFIKSEVGPKDQFDGSHKLPIIRDGYIAKDSEIGW